MSTRQIRGRIEKCEAKLSINEGGVQVVDVFRELWHRDRERYLALAKSHGGILSSLTTQFEREDAERAVRR